MGRAARLLTSFSGPRSFTKATRASSARGTFGLSWPAALLARVAKRTTALGMHGQAFSTAAEHRSMIGSADQRARSQNSIRSSLPFVSYEPIAGVVHTKWRWRNQERFL